ncbi:hypothetical protein Tdes44962_MAKER08551 [Teratosphaeria destructans]|uniref:Uncharacterized protein n=1 Tax=Teratosphaeria destructans TaxID=418781 RepID=A0A9W7W4B0_9PEZI|nr:hypothetical protein Tdes44962_MAKER08551 [Teratosphaeria destructans]
MLAPVNQAQQPERPALSTCRQMLTTLGRRNRSDLTELCSATSDVFITQITAGTDAKTSEGAAQSYREMFDNVLESFAAFSVLEAILDNYRPAPEEEMA